MGILNYQLVGIIAAFCIAAAFFPDCLRLLKSKTTGNLSTLRLSLLVFGSTLWIIYGIRDSSPAIVLLGIFCFTVTSILSVLKLRTKKSSQHD